LGIAAMLVVATIFGSNHIAARRAFSWPAVADLAP
jgi:hypothetical protein